MTNRDIDNAFKKFSEYHLPDHFSKWSIPNEVRTRMETLGLIYCSGEHLRFTKFGLEVKEEGGWLKHIIPKDHNEKLDLMLKHYKLKGSTPDAQYDPQRTKWDELAINTCGENNTEFRLLQEELIKQGFLDTSTGSATITPKGLRFSGYVETDRIEKENAAIKISEPKTPLSKKALGLLTALGILSTMYFSYVDHLNKTEIMDLKNEAKKNNIEIDSLKKELKVCQTLKSK